MATSPAEIRQLTGCTPGTLPPFSFHPQLRLIVDPTLCQRNREIACNAASLTCSLLLDASDYLRIASPGEIEIIKTSDPA
ncbi:hypothetical protein BL250_06830 [Erwinia sp. OLTSP20]|uniref:YbaK/EbsC family protein n=1 Tax=unclassified Erwinia TaxID=2622719 RepID=UPI000C56D6BF|nr:MULTISPECIES: YbaK/EbsC family protein [unclassified Erwinia]PIJ50848.1 hypothetical protein BV501_06560 [Erwinia sp. OAMSP11]PIJ73234.1 hypothetical protein BK416_07225 [Erwinia sp. OLSSP12]PIJ82248.1 hypothetical protein BLD47_06365 [Erwinia sp. OLCASP19]PIJ85400.1 hypothetical protein BLD46_06125 [Erwinia sp. OLMTSP26]PIJ87097.1 hypothetical protein BLD49_06780 [Erwinia sp. OLMDSP33]